MRRRTFQKVFYLIALHFSEENSLLKANLKVVCCKRIFFNFIIWRKVYPYLLQTY